MSDKSSEYFAEFKAELAENITKTIRILRRGGTTAMGLDNLRQVTPTPRRSHGPMGGNCAYVYKQMFAEVVCAHPTAKKFIIRTKGGAA